MATHMDSNPNKKRKFLFKKLAHRPWKPALLETVLQNPTENLLSAEPSQSVFNPDLETNLMCQQLESTIEQKTKERNKLTRKLSLQEENRITVGGFIQPKSVVFSNDEEILKQTAFLMNDLHEKEQEIFTLKHNLKLTQAEEKATLAESARVAEVKAREAAEEKAIYALSKAQQAADYSKIAEERAYIAEQNAFKLEQTIKELQEKLESSSSAQDDLKALNFDLRNTGEDLQRLNREIQDLQQQLTTETNHSAALENEIVRLHEKMVNLTKDHNSVQKLNHLLHLERNLRMLFETKAKEAIKMVVSLEMQKQVEENARRNAEEKAKQTLEQASKAVIQLLNVP